MFKNAKMNEIFAESINKLNKMIEKFDTKTGLNSSTTQPKTETKIVNPKNDVKKIEQNKNNNKSDAKNIKSENQIFYEVDFRVGKVVSVTEPQESDKLYLLKVDLGEGSLREIGTGLRKFVPRQELENSYVIVWANLKPKKLIGGKIKYNIRSFL
jgi:aminoacyl tRNA synthase complex-interacting multifunctional protein 1